MRSGTSCFDWTVFKKTFLRFWPLWAFYSAIWLIVLPLNGLMMLQLDSVNGWDSVTGSYSYIKNFADSTVPGMTAPALFLAVVFGVLAAMAVFSHLYNARSANFFGALPIRREGLFLTHYLSGLAFFIVPNAVIFLLTLLVELAGGCVFLPGLAYWLAVSCGECFFFYSMAVFCGMFTGHILALPAFYGIFNVLASVLMGLFTTTLEVFYYGYAGPGQWLETAARWLTPVWALADEVRAGYFHYDYANSGVQETYVLDGLGAVGVYAAVALALTAGAFLLYRVRRLESAGDVVSVKCMRPVFRYGVALMAGLCFGYVTCFFLGGGEITLMVSIVAWGVAGCFAAQMLLDKSFRVFRKWKGAAAVAAAFIVLFLAIQFDFTGFESRIPNEADVMSMEVSGLSWDWYSDSGDRMDLELDDPASIRLMMDLHRAAVVQRDGEKRGLYHFTSGSRTTSFNITYHLANGSTLSRSYYVSIDPSQVDQEGTAAWALERIYADRDLYWRVYGFDTLEAYLSNGWRLESAGHYYRSYDEEYGDYYVEDPDGYFYGADAQVLLDAVEEDFRAGRIGVRSVTGGEGYAPDGYERNVGFEARFGSDQRYTVNIFVPDTASSTLAALEAAAGRGGGGSTVPAG